MRPEFVDFHCHLDLYPDLKDAIARCDALRTATLAVTTTPKAFPRNRQLAMRSEFVRVGLGLHPQLVEERAGELNLFERLLSETRYVGEVGLDAAPRHFRSFERQKQTFRRILNLCADAGDKVLSVHSVRSAKHVLDLIEECLPADRGTVVLHWFTGSVAEAKRGVQMGCFFSVNERMLSSPNGRRVLGAIPDDRLLTETDGPFVERSGRPIGPGDVNPALHEIANVRGINVSVVQTKIVENLRNLLSRHAAA
jgi:TatD DNase family protein